MTETSGQKWSRELKGFLVGIFSDSVKRSHELSYGQGYDHAANVAVGFLQDRTDALHEMTRSGTALNKAQQAELTLLTDLRVELEKEFQKARDVGYIEQGEDPLLS